MAITWYRFDIGVSPDLLAWIWSAVEHKRIQINPTVAIVFSGSPIPILSLGPKSEYVEIRWASKVEAQIPGIDPNIEYIRVFKDHALIYLAAGNVRADFTKPSEKSDVLHRVGK